MQKALLNLLYLVAPVVLFSCQDKEKDNGQFDLKKLEGTWQFIHERTHEIAKWESDGHGGLKGSGFVLDGSDTIFIEFLRIRNTPQGLVWYASTSPDDTLDQVPFNIVKQSTKRLEFYNGNYGFPQRIVYKLMNDTMIVHYIEGMQENQEVRTNFIYEKAK